MTAIIGDISFRNDNEVEWTIRDFLSYTEEGACYFSPEFRISGSQWYLKVCPNFRTSKYSGSISLYLHKADIASPAVGACYVFGVRKADGTVENFNSSITWVFDEDFPGYGCREIIARSDFLRRKSELAPSDTLTLTCNLETKNLKYSVDLDSLSRNFADLFISKRGSDATLMVKGKEFAVHRSILLARSSVFASMFEVDMKEKSTGIVEISDCDPEAFEKFLKYLYSGKIEENSSNAMEMYRIADKYDVEDLKSHCRMSILGNISTENVLDAVVLGHQFDETAMKNKTQYIFNENFERIIFTTEWDEFSSANMTLANRLLKSMTKEKTAEKKITPDYFSTSF